MALARRTPLRRGGTINRTRPLRQSPPTDRDWRDARRKVEDEGRCRVCDTPTTGPVRIEAAHTIGRDLDRPKPHPAIAGPTEGPLWVDPLDVVPLCADCHRVYDARGLDLLPHMSRAEQARAVGHVGIVAALRRLTGQR